ncbi:MULTISPECIES: LicD family protein [Aliarcobacter]|uniref:LicD family protein n=1 Tax=Aliarcobacter TaxID=2321111 RepID=UPI0021B29F43|nr:MULTISPECIES: LicD family protein [Aliarcobacter]MCT7481225.1 LicD family protein [Aliarcobacter cryaerophilus]MCT7537894.1 LicD family protein [Aliarcobacter butzleri]MCT7624870.1 LicD family protein [Aliarcobacter butzleri]MCT7626843.1 LicD family protein [Aliarcobacter butzleri]
MKNVIIFGTGEFAKNIYNQYKNDLNIINFSDNNKDKHNTLFFEKLVVAPKDLTSIDFDEIIIASSYSEEIYQQLVEDLNLDKNKIRRLYVNESKVQFYSKEKVEKSEYFMFEICRLLEENHISYYIDHGTLLGIIRDEALIPWDTDIDLAVLIEDKEKIETMLKSYLNNFIHPLCKTNNWKYKIEKEEIIVEGIKETLYTTFQIFNYSNFQEDEVALELMFRYKRDSIIYWGFCEKYLKAPLDITLPTKQIFYKGHPINVPNNTMKYLSNLYGDWKTPIKNWTYDKYNNLQK